MRGFEKWKITPEGEILILSIIIIRCIVSKNRKISARGILTLSFLCVFGRKTVVRKSDDPILVLFTEK